MLLPVLFALLVLLISGGPARAEAGAAEADDELDILAGQMLMVGFRGLEAGPDSAIARDIANLHLGGVVLFDYDVALKKPGRNITGPAQLLALTLQLKAASDGPLFIAVDQEGGKVQRLKASTGFAETPSAAELGQAGKDTSATREAGAVTGLQLALYGVNVDFAPVLDVDVNPLSPAIGALDRSFSADPDLVALHGAAFLDGLRASGVLGCVKHFPGHGSAGQDSHTGLPDITTSWTETELKPFARIIASCRADMVMTAHLFNARLDPELPATLSPAVIDGLLRRELGFDGVVVTDDLNMAAISGRYGLKEAIRLAVLAGCDVLLFGNNLSYDPDIAAKAHAALVELVRDGDLSLDRLRRSGERIHKLKLRLQPTGAAL